MAKPPYVSIIDQNLDPKKSLDERVKLIKQIEALTGRRLLVYVADIRKPESSLALDDKTGFSDLVDGVDGENIDVLLNSPGGLAEVTESIVGLLRARYKSIRFVVPNAAKSAATLMALSGDAILMDARSELGPIDPQLTYPSKEGMKREAAEDITEGFKAAKEALMKAGPTATPAYLPLLEKYTIGLLQACENAKRLSETLAQQWLAKYMFAANPNSPHPAEIATYFGSHTATLSHSRAIRIDKCEELKLNIFNLDKPENIALRDLIWMLWCHYELHFERGLTVTKLYENSSGCTLQKQGVVIQVVQQQKPALPPRPPGSPLPGLPGGPRA